MGKIFVGRKYLKTTNILTYMVQHGQHSNRAQSQVFGSVIFNVT